ncbi:MAG: DUF362 domain-containing protein, partial [Nitrospirae bacterium]
MKQLLFKKIQSYNDPALGEFVTHALDTLIKETSLENKKVLIKPNLLAPSRPDQAVCTHPEVVYQVARYFVENGAVVQISDSPAVGNFEKIVQSTGLKKHLAPLGVEIKPFRKSILADIGAPFGKIEIAEDALTSDLLVNLPKLKTHSQMLLTLAVKNLFGCIVGMRKPEWHLRAGIDRERFAELLYLIAKKLSPQINLLDGILGMHGDGPGKSGTPVRTAIVVASPDPLLVDIAVCKYLGVSPHSLPTVKAAMVSERGLTVEDVEFVERFEREFNLPNLGPVVFGPAFLHGFMRRHLTERPVLSGRCMLCKE